MLDAAGPLDVFAEANALLAPGEGYALTTVGPSRSPVASSNGLDVIPQCGFDDAATDFDLLLVAGGPALPQQRPPQALLDWLSAAARHAQCVGSICTGAFVLAHARLLDGRAAATHWRHVDDLARQSQFSPFLASLSDAESLLGRVQRYVLEHLADPLGVPQLARQMAVSPRHFARGFTHEAQMSPA